jgi:hypothetical protein
LATIWDRILQKLKVVQNDISIYHRETCVFSLLACFELIIAYAEGTKVFFKNWALTCSKTNSIDTSRTKLTLS